MPSFYVSLCLFFAILFSESLGMTLNDIILSSVLCIISFIFTMSLIIVEEIRELKKSSSEEEKEEV